MLNPIVPISCITSTRHYTLAPNSISDVEFLSHVRRMFWVKGFFFADPDRSPDRFEHICRNVAPRYYTGLIVYYAHHSIITKHLAWPPPNPQQFDWPPGRPHIEKKYGSPTSLKAPVKVQYIDGLYEFSVKFERTNRVHRHGLLSMLNQIRSNFSNLFNEKYNFPLIITNELQYLHKFYKNINLE